MNRIFKGMAWTIAVILMALVVVVAWGRLRGPTEAQAKALALLHRDSKPSNGRNAFPALWLADYDVPADQLDTVLAQDRLRLQAWLVKLPPVGTEPVAFVDAASGRYAKLPPLSDADKALSCAIHDDDCLAKVRNHREAVRALLSRHEVRLRHEESLDNYDYEWSEMPTNVNTPPPPYSSAQLRLTAAALNFADGQQATALNRTCTNALTMRRLHASNNTLIGTMVADARLQAAANLFIQMLGELPVGQTLPDSCAQAFAAVGPEDGDLCPSMPEEFRHMANILDVAESAAKAKGSSLSLSFQYSRDITLRLAADGYAWPCGEGVRTKSLADLRFNEYDTPVAQPDFVDRIADPLGYILVAMGRPAFGAYINRHQDTAAVLRLVATVMWLRQTHGGGRMIAERLAQRPVWMDVDKGRQLHIAEDNHSIHMDYHSPNGHRPDKRWPTEWPLPVGL
jgi:hypothetical protein